MVDWTTATGSRWVTTTVASGKVAQEGPELLEVLGRLEDPALLGVDPLQNLEHRLHVGVVRSLVVGEVVVAPLRAPRHPLERVAREVGQLQLDLLVHVIGLHRVHGRHERRRGLHGLPGALATGPPWIHPVDLGRLLRVPHRLVGLPERHGSEPRVRGQQVDEVGGARTRQPDHYDRPGDGDLEDLGVAGQQVADEEAVGGAADAVGEHQQSPDAGSLFVGVHLGQLQAESHGETLVPEVGQAGALPGGVTHGIDREVGRLRFPVADGHPLDVVEDGGVQVVDLV